MIKLLNFHSFVSTRNFIQSEFHTGFLNLSPKLTIHTINPSILQFVTINRLMRNLVAPINLSRFSNIIIWIIIGLLVRESPETLVFLDEIINMILSENIILIIVALITAVVIHELGHAIAAILIRRRILWICVGPIYWLNLSWHHGFFWGKPVPGTIGSVYSSIREDEVDRLFPAALLLLGGVIANLLTIPLGYEASLMIEPGSMSWFFDHLVVVSAFLLVTNLIPIGISDGAQLFKLIKSKGINPEHLAEQSIHLEILEGVTPSHWSNQAINDLDQSSTPDHQTQALAFKAEKAIAAGAIEEAETFINTLEQRLPESSTHVAKIYYMLRTELLIRNGDTTAAKKTLEQTLPYHVPASVWLAKAEIALAEGREQQAHTTANKAIKYLAKCPWARGYYNGLNQRWSSLSSELEVTSTAIRKFD